jgi:hypothetical protein
MKSLRIPTKSVIISIIKFKTTFLVMLFFFVLLMTSLYLCTTGNWLNIYENELVG